MLYALLPFTSAAFYGMSYILLEKMLKSVNILSYMVCSNIIFTCALAVSAYLMRKDFNPSFVYDKKLLILFLGTVGFNIGGWLITLASLQKNTAVYTAFAEISYPLFILLFLFLIFHQSEWNWQILLGGAFVFVGSVILVSAQNSGAKP